MDNTLPTPYSSFIVERGIVQQIVDGAPTQVVDESTERIVPRKYRPRSKPPLEKRLVSLSDQEWTALGTAAERRGCTRSKLLIELVNQAINAQAKPEPERTKAVDHHFSAPKEFWAAVDLAAGYRGRTQFIRAAVRTLLAESPT